MKRVLHFIPAFEIGGVESLVMSLYRQIDKKKIQFDFLVETKDYLEQFKEIEEMGGKIYKLQKLDKSKPFNYLKELNNFFKKRANDYIAVHSHNIDRGLLFLYFAKKYGIKCRISHAHSNSFQGNTYPILLRVIARLNTFLSNNLFACSKEAGKFQYGKNNNFTVIKNSIDTKKFLFSEEIRKKVREEYNLSNSFVIGHTGRFTYAKNHQRIIEIFYELNKSLPSSKLILVGDGPLKKEIKKRVYQLGLSDKVIFTGKVSNVEYILHAFDVFLLPSFYEGFCISLLEAQALGIPCITSDVIPKDVQITNLITKVSLNDKNKVWKNHILNKRNFFISSKIKEVKKYGYDVEHNSEWLTNYYLNCQKNLL